jgi:Predicted flavoprotein
LNTISAIEQRLPTGTWNVDPVHSQVGFAVDYLVGTFRGSFSPVEGTLTVAEDGTAELKGSAQASGIKVQDGNLSTHLLSPDFFDIERTPEISFSAADIRRTGDEGTVNGELTIKGITRPGRSGRHDQRAGRARGRERADRSRARDDHRPHPVRPELEHAAAERQAGTRKRRDPVGRAVPGEGVTTMKVLGISGSLRRDSYNTALLRNAPLELDLWDGLKAIPPYDEDDDVEPAPPAVAQMRAAVAGADAILFATPEYNASIPGQLKNAVDWLSRPQATSVLRNKPVAVVGASTGAFGAVWAKASSARCSRPPAPGWSTGTSPSVMHTSASTRTASSSTTTSASSSTRSRRRSSLRSICGSRSPPERRVC